MGFYEFKREDALSFLRDKGVQYKPNGDELLALRCPYCNGGKTGRDKYTFAINMKTGLFNCKRGSCGRKGNMITLSKDFDFSLGREVYEYYRKTQRFKDLSKLKKPEPKPKAVEHLEKRGISRRITEKYGITVRKDNENVLVIPFFDENGKMQYIKYRNMEFQKGNGSKEWSEKNCKSILFGMGECDPENPCAVLTEGQIDALSVAECDIPNALSVPSGKEGFQWTPHCWDWLNNTFKELIVFGDYEKGEITLLHGMKTRFNGVIKHVRPEDYLDCKDANELLMKHGKEAVINAVKNAVRVKNPRISCLSEIQKVDISKLERFTSSIESLDKVIGGLYLGQLIALTGERGKGKSTLSSQIGISAAMNGYPVFFYSGEMTDYSFEDWFSRQVAGNRNIRSKVDEFGSRSFQVLPSAYDKIRWWYEDRVYLYNNDVIEDEVPETEALPKTLEVAIRQYGCKVLIIDNLMTAMIDDVRSDLYRQQSNFVRDLAKMAKRYNVLIILVAHPRKRATGSRGFSNDDISGAGNITNLCDVVLRYDVPDVENADPTDRTIVVLKNRLTGKLTGGDGIPLYFEESSKRISETPDFFDWKVGWEDIDDEPEQVNDDDLDLGF